MPALNSTIYITNTIQNIDQWKIYININTSEYQQISANEVDYICPWIKFNEIRVYSFNAPYTLTNLSIGDTFTLRFNPAGYDNTHEGINDAFIFESNEFTVTASSEEIIQINDANNILNISQYTDISQNIVFKDYDGNNININMVQLDTAGFINIYGVGYQPVDSKRIYLTAGEWHQISIGGFLSSGTDVGIGIHVRI